MTDPLAEVERIAGPAAANLIADAKAGDIRPEDLLRWVQDWDRKRRETGGRCSQCGGVLQRTLTRTCLECIRSEG